MGVKIGQLISDVNKISTFERNVLRNIYGPIKVNGEFGKSRIVPVI